MEVPPCTATGTITATGGGITHTTTAEVKVIPGFGGIFALIGLLAAVYLIRRRS